MKDLNRLYAKLKCTKTFHNFFRCEDFLMTFDYLVRTNTPRDKILQKVPPSRGNAAQHLAHPLIVMSFLRWASMDAYNKTLVKLMAAADTPVTDEDATDA